MVVSPLWHGPGNIHGFILDGKRKNRLIAGSALLQEGLVEHRGLRAQWFFRTWFSCYYMAELTTTEVSAEMSV